MMRHLAWNFLVDPTVRFYQTPFSSDLPEAISKVLSTTFPQYLVRLRWAFDVGGFPRKGPTLRLGSERQSGGAGGTAAGRAESVCRNVPHDRRSPVLPAREKPEDGECSEANQSMG